jgi:hypothetical protein
VQKWQQVSKLWYQHQAREHVRTAARAVQGTIGQVGVGDGDGATLLAVQAEIRVQRWQRQDVTEYYTAVTADQPRM